MTVQEAIENWLRRASKLAVGERLSIEVLNKKEGTKLKNEFLEMKTQMELVDFELTKVAVYSVWYEASNKFVVELVKRPIDLTAAILTKHDGTRVIERIGDSMEKKRIIDLMIRDGLSRFQILENLENLSEEEEIYLNELTGTKI